MRCLRDWLLLPALDRRYWNGPPYTYGFGVGLAYTPWAGWHVGFGFGWTWGATVAVGWGWGAYPWWGGYGLGRLLPVGLLRAAAWRGGREADGRMGARLLGWHDREHVPPLGLHDGRDAARGGYNAWTGNRWATQAGRSYNSRTGVAAAGQRGVVGNVYSGNYAAGAVVVP